jgi:hypothetical protein
MIYINTGQFLKWNFPVMFIIINSVLGNMLNPYIIFRFTVPVLRRTIMNARI